MLEILHVSLTAGCGASIALGFYFLKHWVSGVDKRMESVLRYDGKLAELKQSVRHVASKEEFAVLRTEFDDTKKSIEASLDATNKTLSRIEQRVDRVLELQMNGMEVSIRPRIAKKKH